MKLTFYLFNESVKEFSQALNQSKLAGDEAFQELTPKTALPFEAAAYFQQNKPKTPKWLGFLENHFDLDAEEIRNQTNSFLLLIKVEERIFAITTGFGFTALDRSALESGFGLRVTLNEVDPQKIKGVDIRNIDTSTKQKRILINRNSPLFDFEFDVDEDLLNLISGQPRDAGFAKKLAGSDSLHFTGDFTLDDLGQKCILLLDSFRKDNYKQNFAFIDHLRMVRDKTIIRQLDDEMLKAYVNRQHEKLMLAYPELDSLHQVEDYKVQFGRANTYTDEVDLVAVYNFLDEKQISIVDPEKIDIIGLDHDRNAVTKKFTLKDYTVFETDLNGKKYLFSLGRWFEIAADYVQQINDEIKAIDEIASTGFMPQMRKGQREDAYNDQVAKANKWVLLDKKNYPTGGNSKVEVCDLLTPGREFICVKKYNGSSTLSHLFSQGVVSASMLDELSEYRRFIIDHCPQSWPTLFDVVNIDKGSITFVFAIATEAQGSVVEALPFFSKVNLRNAKKVFQKLGFNLKTYKINLI